MEPDEILQVGSSANRRRGYTNVVHAFKKEGDREDRRRIIWMCLTSSDWANVWEDTADEVTCKKCKELLKLA